MLKTRPDLVVTGECRNGPEAVELLNSHAADLVFLDIQMPQMDGFEVLANLKPPRPAIVFVTAFDRFAIRAFEVNAIDYLLKPVDDLRFDQAIERARCQIEKPDLAGIERKLTALLASRAGLVEEHVEPAYPKRIPVRSGARLIFVETEDIDYVQANDYYSAIHIGPKTHLLREPMKSLEDRLDPKVFLRVHRSVIVNVRRVRELRRLTAGGYALLLNDGTTLKTSRSRWHRVQQMLSV
jgi:two-component system, LytTR family, response regulator